MANVIAAVVMTAVALLVSHLYIPIWQWHNMSLPGDAAIFSYILAWGAHAIFHFPWKYYDVPLFYPGSNMLPGTDGLELQSLLLSPVWYVSKNPVLTYNIATFLSHLFCMVAAYYAARLVLRLHRVWCVLIAVFFTVSAGRLWHAFGHQNLIWTGILPLIFAQTWASLKYEKRSHFIGLGLAVGASVYLSVYLFVIGILMIAVAVALWLVYALRFPSRRILWLLAVAGLLGLMIAAPKILVYKNASGRSSQERNSLLQASYYSASPGGYLQPTYRPHRLVSFWYKVLPVPANTRQTDENEQFVGYFLVLLLLVESIRLFCRLITRKFDRWDRLSAGSITVCAVLVLCSFGPNFRIPLGGGLRLSPYILLYKVYLEHTGFFRVPARLAFIVQWVSLIPVGILLMRATLLTRLQTFTYSAAGIALVLFEHAPATHPFLAEWTRLTIFDRMDELDPSMKEAFIALDPELSVTWCTLSNAGHWRPAVNGWLSSPLGKDFDQLTGLMKTFPNTATLRWLAENKVKWILASFHAQKAMAEADPRLKLVGSSQGYYLFTLTNPAAILEEWKAETVAWKAQVDAQKATLPPETAWPGGDFLLPAGGDHLKKTGLGSLIIKTTEVQFASILFDPTKLQAPAVWEAVELKYRLKKPNRHAAKLYWKTEEAPMSEDRAVHATVTAPEETNGVWTARFTPKENPMWLTDKTLTRMRFDFHSFQNTEKEAEVEVLSVTLYSTDAR